MRLSGLRVNGIQVMRDYEGLSGPLHRYKVETVKTMLKLCEAVGAERLLICSSTSAHASGDVDHIAADLRKVAMLATPLGIRVGYEALSWGRHVSDFELSWEIVQRADRANLGVCIDAFHVLANCGLNGTNFDALATIPGERIAFVQLSDFLWKAVRTPEERIETARHLRVFPGEGVHSAELSRMIRMIDRSGYRGDWSFEVFNDDYLQMPVDIVAQRARCRHVGGGAERTAQSAADTGSWQPLRTSRRIYMTDFMQLLLSGVATGRSMRWPPSASRCSGRPLAPSILRRASSSCCQRLPC